MAIHPISGSFSDELTSALESILPFLEALKKRHGATTPSKSERVFTKVSILLVDPAFLCVDSQKFREVVTSLYEAHAVQIEFLLLDIPHLCISEVASSDQFKKFSQLVAFVRQVYFASLSSSLLTISDQRRRQLHSHANSIR